MKLADWLADPGFVGYGAAAALFVAGVVTIGYALTTRRSAGIRKSEPIEHVVASPDDDPIAAAQASLARFDELQRSLRAQFVVMENALRAEREGVHAAVAEMRLAAAEMRLPETVVEIYDSLRALPRKSVEAQAEDCRWHARAGITPGRVLSLSDGLRETEVGFEVQGRPMRIRGRSYALTRSNFDELSLIDGDGTVVLMVKVRRPSDTLAPGAAEILGYRPGDWLASMTECRLRMDARRHEALLAAGHRDVVKLREDFGLSRPASRASTAAERTN